MRPDHWVMNKYRNTEKHERIERGTVLTHLGTETDNAVVEAVNPRYVVVRVPGGSYFGGIGMRSYAPAHREVLRVIEWDDDCKGFTAESVMTYDIRQNPGRFWDRGNSAPEPKTRVKGEPS